MKRAQTPCQTRRPVGIVTRPLHQMQQLIRTQIADEELGGSQEVLDMILGQG
jgi:hypothetical protein